MKHLTTEQAQAIQVWAKDNGRAWKARLRAAWMCADVIHLGTVLYGLRNTHGPAWLDKFRFDSMECGR